MRVAPIGLVTDDAFDLGVNAAALSHGHPTGYLAAGAFAQIIRDMFTGATIRDAIDHALSILATHEHSSETVTALTDALSAADLLAPTADAVEQLGEGWVAEEALAIACYCALVTTDVRAGLLLAVNHSGDSDSTGSITGNLLGVQHGIESIPNDLLAGLAERRLVETVASDLVDAFLDNTEPDYARYPPW
jgi:ADP-ribosylglycohydrolase